MEIPNQIQVKNSLLRATADALVFSNKKRKKNPIGFIEESVLYVLVLQQYLNFSLLNVRTQTLCNL